MTTPADVEIQADHLNTVAQDALRDATAHETVTHDQKRKLERQWRTLHSKIKRWARDLEKLETASLK